MKTKARKKFIIVAYDISDDKNRLKTSELLQIYGTRINFSVYECMMTESQMSKVQIKIDQYIDTSTDKVVYYNICVNCFTKIIKQPQQEIENPTIKVI